MLANYSFVLIMFDTVGGSNLTFEIFGLSLPGYLFIISTGFILISSALLPKWKIIHASAIFLICGFFLILRQGELIGNYFSNDLEDVHHISIFFMFLFPVLLTYIGSCIILANYSSNLTEYFVSNNTPDDKRVFSVIIFGTLAFLAVVVAFNLVSKGILVHPYWITPFSDWSLSLLLRLFYFVIPSHLLAFAVLGKLLDKIPGDSTSNKWLEVISCAMIFSLINYSVSYFGYTVREFFFGLIFAFMYTRTRSLTYGVLLQTLLMHFTA